VPAAILGEPLVDAIGEPRERELPQRRQVPRAEVICERRIDPLGRVDVAASETVTQRERCEVDELELVRPADDLVRDRLALPDGGDLLDDVVQRLEVLDVQRRDDVDARGEQLFDVLPALRVARAGTFVCASSSTSATCGRRRSTASTSISSNVLSRKAIVRRGTTSSPAICSAVFRRPCDSTKPTTTSSPYSARRRPSFSIANVLPTPAAAPR
jgi:hypothetical protein